MKARVLAGAVALALGAAGGAQAQDKHEVKVAMFVGAQHFMSQWLMKWAEKLEKGKPVDPKTAKEPVYHTEKRPYSLDDLRKQQMKELEDIMDDAKGKVRSKSGKGMGLW